MNGRQVKYGEREFIDGDARDSKVGSACAANAPRVDGLYVRGPLKGDRRSFPHYLRFRPANLVCGVTSSGTVTQVSRWIGPDHPGIGQGTYELDLPAISLATTSSSGTVRSRGQVAPDALTITLDSHSLINGHRAHSIYCFEQSDFPG